MIGDFRKGRQDQDRLTTLEAFCFYSQERLVVAESQSYLPPGKLEVRALARQPAGVRKKDVVQLPHPQPLPWSLR